MPETPTLLLADIVDHPANPRRDAVADQEMVDSIRAQGLYEPLMVAPRGDGKYTLIDGHRRKNGCVQAGRDRAPVNIRYDLVTEAQQVEAMIITGLHKALLTPVEEAAAYEQLALLGMDEAAIAAASGFGVRRVRSRLKLNALSDVVRTKVHVGDATLTDLAVLEEFAGDAAATADLEASLGTSNFQHTAAALRLRRQRRERRAGIIETFEAAGAVRLERAPGDTGPATDADGAAYEVRSLRTHPVELQSPEAHDGCLAYVVNPLGPDTIDPYLVCSNPGRHPSLGTPAPTQPVHQTSEWEKRQAERAERALRHEAAVLNRVSWLREHFAAMFPTRTHSELAAAARAGLPLLVIDGRDTFPDTEVLLAGLDALPDQRDLPTLEAAKSSYAATLTDAKPTTVLAGFAGYLAALVGDQINVEDAQFVDDVTEAGYMLGVWDWLKQAGYPLSDVDKAERTALEVRHTELVAEAEAAAS